MRDPNKHRVESLAVLGSTILAIFVYNGVEAKGRSRVALPLANIPDANGIATLNVPIKKSVLPYLLPASPFRKVLQVFPPHGLSQPKSADLSAVTEPEIESLAKRHMIPVAERRAS